MLFTDLPLNPNLLKRSKNWVCTSPTPVQEAAILRLIVEDKFNWSARTGTGKTAAFGLPMIQRVDVKNKSVQGLVIAPTRELCVQIAKKILSLFLNI